MTRDCTSYSIDDFLVGLVDELMEAIFLDKPLYYPPERATFIR